MLTRIPRREVESLDDFDATVERSANLDGWTVQSVDLRPRGRILSSIQVAGALFLGCEMDDVTENSLVSRGALVFPSLPSQPFNPYRVELYTAEDLYDSAHYSQCFDAKVYTWYIGQPTPAPIPASLAMTIHDHSILESVEDRLHSAHSIVGVMGGHATKRTDAAYLLAAELGSALAASGHAVATGGGPGAMEAANLGARAGGGFREAVEELRRVPDFAPDISAWAATAMDVARKLPEGKSIGVPTWYYGHEPPNVFATMIAKLFSNAIREDLLLKLCGSGIVYLPGAAGTVQEVFQAATRNYYSSDESSISAMIFLGREYWTQRIPAPALLTSMASGRAMADRIFIVDTCDEVLTALSACERKAG